VVVLLVSLLFLLLLRKIQGNCPAGLQLESILRLTLPGDRVPAYGSCARICISCSWLTPPLLRGGVCVT